MIQYVIQVPLRASRVVERFLCRMYNILQLIDAAGASHRSHGTKILIFKLNQTRGVPSPSFILDAHIHMYLYTHTFIKENVVSLPIPRKSSTFLLSRREHVRIHVARGEGKI